VREGEKLLNEGKDLTEVLRQLEVSESTWNRWRAEYAGMKGRAEYAGMKGEDMKVLTRT
jgi:hypothetical protein